MHAMILIPVIGFFKVLLFPVLGHAREI